MVVPSLDPARETYLLWHRFSMPTASGSKDAFAVSSTVGGYFNSAYTFLLQLIVLQVWAIIINVGLLLFYRKESHSYRSVVVSTGIWNSMPSTGMRCQCTPQKCFSTFRIGRPVLRSSRTVSVVHSSSGARCSRSNSNPVQ